MKVAVVTTSAREVSSIGHATQRLLPELAGLCEIELFVPAHAGEQLCGVPTHSLRELRPRELDHILYPVGNERALGFVAPLVRQLGGVVWLRDWVLSDFALGAFPALGRRGLRGRLAAVRSGGVGQSLRWARAVAQGADWSELPLNRPIVRHADAFLVEDEQMRAKILEERNAPTPIGLLREADEPPLSFEDDEGAARAARRAYELLDRLPPHRTNRKSLIRTAIERADAARAERAAERAE